MRLFFSLFFFVFAAAVASAAPQVVTTHTVLSDLVTVIAADRVQVNCLLPLNLDPHSYEPKPADIRLLARADLVVINGLGLEPWADKVIANSGFRGPVIKAAETIPHALHAADHQDHDHHGPEANHYDPHAWHNPKNVMQYIAVIRDALINVAPADASFFQENAERYLTELKAVDEFARRQFETIPLERRKLVTSHDSLRYLADAYSLTIVPIAGTRPDQEPSARQLAALVKVIRDQQVRAVFFEATTSPKLVEMLAKEAGVAVVGQLYTDSLGSTGSPGATYLGMFRANVDTLVRALR